MAAVAAGLAIARARTIRKIKKTGAISKESAKKQDELGVHESFLKWMIKAGDLRQTEDGRYYVPCEDGKHC